jgi:phosphonatase-like hydrolase
LVVFDLAGTTVRDRDNVHSFLQEALRKEGIAISRDEANAVMGIAKPVAIRQLLEAKLTDASRITASWIDRIHGHFLAGTRDFYRYDPAVSEKEGVSDTFRALKARGIKIAVDTGFDRSITEAILGRVPWREAGLLDAGVTSDEVARGRPFPEMIYRAMQLTGVADPSAVAKVGDTASRDALGEWTNRGYWEKGEPRRHGGHGVARRKYFYPQRTQRARRKKGALNRKGRNSDARGAERYAFSLRPLRLYCALCG